MANSLTFTSEIFSVGTLFATASAATASGYIVTTTATPYDIMGGTVSYDRRFYGISAYNTGPAQTLTVYLWDGTKNSQLFQISAAIGSTTPTVTDLFNSNNISIFINGTRYATTTYGGNWGATASGGVNIGCNRGDTWFFPGYIWLRAKLKL